MIRPLDPMPAGWPRGWWRAPGKLRCVLCHKDRYLRSVIPEGAPMFASDKEGEVFCRSHAARGCGAYLEESA